MATVHEPKRLSRGNMPLPLSDEQRFCVAAIDFPTYVAIADLLGERHIRATYAGGVLELMTLSQEHEHLKTLIGAFIETLVVERDIDMKPGGFMTLRRVDLERGIEADECYWIANEAAVRHVKEFDFAKDPPPDLAVEVEISRSSLDRMDIYRRLRVPEVWRCDADGIHFEVLSDDGQYEPSERSKAFAFLRSDSLYGVLTAVPDLSRTKLLQYFRTWIREQIEGGWQA
jgi:Uma2 family endonuclease